MAKISKTERETALANLRKWFPKGSTVYTILRSVGRTGMSRTIGIVSIETDNGEPIVLHPNYAVSVVLGLRWKSGGIGDGVMIQGAGMDIGFEIAYRLGRVLYDDGYALKHRWI